MENEIRCRCNRSFLTPVAICIVTGATTERAWQKWPRRCALSKRPSGFNIWNAPSEATAAPHNSFRTSETSLSCDDVPGKF
ncbi:Hypothetical protein SMAX5B_000650 [Scophthalmus maximus]|uniref:Uncharacterized protein n=1 Tax=Scophthalmus maximus TaxID=52904 RepID=A0A2U9B5S9_SCOMX|nr:Hypothetical protein SMAX5B_000650 [Scophthalmus maximus]